jgi:ketosteroid isomerase-like protein
MNEQQNSRLVQQFYEAFKRGDITGVLNIFADDADLFIPGPKDINRLWDSAKAASRSPSSSRSLRKCRTQNRLRSENS